MTKHLNHDRSFTVDGASTIPKKSSEDTFLSKCFSWLPFYKKATFRECPYCDVQLTEANMVQHLQQCQQVTYTATTPDGTMTSISYAGTNREIRAAMIQDASYNKNNLEYNKQEDYYAGFNETKK
jgi:hypothetical protein